MIKAVIFDMDGVIIDSEPIYFRIISEMLREMEIEITRDELSKFVGRSDLWETFKEKYELDYNVDDISDEEQKRFLSYLKNHFEDGPIDGVADLIKELENKGYSLVLASSSKMENINSVLTKLGLIDHFSLRISGADLETSKPHPEIFLEAAKMAQTTQEECLVIEDSENGVKAAKAAGMKCIGYQNPNSGNQDLTSADWIIDHFDQFDWKILDK
jgi:HAD superfamily hydrolase (TIGR01509 family)